MGKRLFIAAKLPLSDQTRKKIDFIRDRLNYEKIKWVEPQNVHLTLKFLGDTDEELIPQIEEKLQQIAGQIPVNQVEVKGLGVFPNPFKPRVLWLGLQYEPALKELYDLIENEMELLGYEREHRDFKPHITLGRIKFLKNRKNLQFLLDKFKNTEFQSVKVNKIILFESELFPTGPVYTELAELQLQQI